MKKVLVVSDDYHDEDRFLDRMLEVSERLGGFETKLTDKFLCDPACWDVVFIDFGLVDMFNRVNLRFLEKCAYANVTMLWCSANDGECIKNELKSNVWPDWFKRVPHCGISIDEIEYALRRLWGNKDSNV